MSGLASLDDYLPLPEGDKQYNLDFITHKKVLLLRENEDRVLVGMVERNQELVNALERFHQKPTEVVDLDANRLAEYLAGLTGGPLQEGGQGQCQENEALDALATDAPMVNLVNSLLLEGIRHGASDIHIESFSSRTLVRFRIDGHLALGRIVSPSHFRGISARIKVMARLNIIEQRLPQDGRLQVSLGGCMVEFRVSVVPIQGGESIVLRLFRQEEKARCLDSLGFGECYLASLRRSARFRSGLVLLTGPTGSGKSTTLSGLLAELHKPGIKIITVEDPVEIVIEGVNQIQTNDAIGLGFDSILQGLLRQDPDVLMIGEIRDRRTAELAIRSALTGHLVLSTLHTNNALSSLCRLADMGIEPFLLSSVLRAASAQRLVRTLCPHCKVQRPPSRHEADLLASHGCVLEFLFQGQGCTNCRQSGYNGRTAIGEIFEFPKENQEVLDGKWNTTSLIAYFKNRGERFLLDSGLDLLARGLTSMEELALAVEL